MQNQPTQQFTPQPLPLADIQAQPKAQQSTLRKFWWVFAIVGILILLIIILSVLQAQYVGRVINNNSQTPVSNPAGTPATQLPVSNPISSPR